MGVHANIECIFSQVAGMFSREERGMLAEKTERFPKALAAFPNGVSLAIVSFLPVGKHNFYFGKPSVRVF